MSFWDLVKLGDYSAAVVGFTEEITLSHSVGAFNNRGMAYLHLGEYDTALADFRSADKISEAQLHTTCEGDMCGVASWMAGRKQEAVAIWSTGVDASIAGNVRYTDSAGGVTIGNLLMFGGVRLGDKNAVDLATRLLKKRLKTKQSAAWPGPISRFLLGTISEEDMLAVISKVPILHERQMGQACFYCGVRALLTGDKDTYSEAMRKSWEFGRVAKIGAEYYLALHEKNVHCSASV